MNAYIWVFLERFSLLILRLAAILILSRILTPEDFGVYAMIAIIASIGTLLIDSGMGGALIKKKNPTDIDYSTVFIYNLVTALILSALIYFSAPLIASFYKTPEIAYATKLLCITLIIRSLAIIQVTRLSKGLKFKPQTIIYFSSYTASLILAIWLANRGYGYLTLVFQQIADAVFTTTFFYLYSRYFPKLNFSLSSFYESFSFGSQLMLSSIIETFYGNIISIIFGKSYGPTITGMHAQAHKVNEIFVTLTTAVIDKASFPLLVRSTDHNELYLQKISELLRMTTFICFIIIMIIAACADSIIPLLLGNQWSSSVWMLQIISFAGIGMIVESVTRSFLKAKGRADKILRLEIIKRFFSIATLIVCLPLGVKTVLIAYVCTTLINASLNMYMVELITGYKFFNQFKDMAIPLILSSLVFLILSEIEPHLELINILKIAFMTCLGIIIYSCLAYIFRLKELIYLRGLLIKLLG